MKHSSSRAAREWKREKLRVVRESEDLIPELEASLDALGWHLCAGHCGARVAEQGDFCINCYRGSAA